MPEIIMSKRNTYPEDCYIQKYFKELKSGDYLSALRNIKGLLAIYPGNFKAYYLRANLLLLYKDYENALKDYNECLRLNPDYPEAYINRGLIKKTLGDFNGSNSDFLEAKKLGYFK